MVSHPNMRNPLAHTKDASPPGPALGAAVGSGQVAFGTPGLPSLYPFSFLTPLRVPQRWFNHVQLCTCCWLLKTQIPRPRAELLNQNICDWGPATSTFNCVPHSRPPRSSVPWALKSTELITTPDLQRFMLSFCLTNPFFWSVPDRCDLLWVLTNSIGKASLCFDTEFFLCFFVEYQAFEVEQGRQF